MSSAVNNHPDEVELVDFSSHDEGLQSAVIRRARVTESWCGRMVCNYMQYTPSLLAIQAVVLVVPFGLYGVGAYYIDNIEFLKWGGVVAGGVGAIFAATVGGVTTTSSLTIAHLRTPKNLDGEIATLNSTLTNYRGQIASLKGLNKRLSGTVGDFKKLYEHQIEIKGSLEQTFKQKIDSLDQVNLQLKTTQEDLGKTEKILELFQQKVEEANALNNQISDKIREASVHLPAVGIDQPVLNEGDVVVNMGALDDADASFDAHNDSLRELTGELQRQLAMMGNFEETLKSHAEVFQRGVQSLDETDDKIKDAAVIMEKSTRDRMELLHTLSENSKNIFAIIKAAIMKMEHSETKDNFLPIIKMIDELYPEGPNEIPPME